MRTYIHRHTYRHTHTHAFKNQGLPRVKGMMTFCETCKELINTGCFSILIRCWLLSFKGYCLLQRNVQLQMCIIPQRLKCVAFVLPKEKSGRIWPWFLMLNMQHIDLPLFCRGVPLLRMKNALGTLLTNPIPIPKYSSLLWYKDAV